MGLSRMVLNWKLLPSEFLYQTPQWIAGQMDFHKLYTLLKTSLHMYTKNKSCFQLVQCFISYIYFVFTTANCHHLNWRNQCLNSTRSKILTPGILCSQFCRQRADHEHWISKRYPARPISYPWHLAVTWSHHSQHQPSLLQCQSTSFTADPSTTATYILYYTIYL